MPDIASTLPLHNAADAERLFSHLLAQARARGVALRPVPPAPTSCCGRGCNGCVWEGFLAAAGFWRDDAVLALRAAEMAAWVPAFRSD